MIARTKTRSKKSSSGVTRSPSRRTALRRGASGWRCPGDEPGWDRPWTRRRTRGQSLQVGVLALRAAGARAEDPEAQEPVAQHRRGGVGGDQDGDLDRLRGVRGERPEAGQRRRRQPEAEAEYGEPCAWWVIRPSRPRRPKVKRRLAAVLATALRASAPALATSGAAASAVPGRGAGRGSCWRRRPRRSGRLRRRSGGSRAGRRARSGRCRRASRGRRSSRPGPRGCAGRTARRGRAARCRRTRPDPRPAGRSALTTLARPALNPHWASEKRLRRVRWRRRL